MSYLEYKGAMCVFVLLVFGLNCTEADPRKTWFEAQQICRTINKKLTTDTRLEQSFWTGRYHRISEWLKILGCFNDSDVEEQAVKEAIIYNPSAGLCQEICLQSESNIFAIKSNRCICLTEYFKGESIHPSHCNYSCNSTRDRKFASDCGGQGSFNVYSFEKKEFSNLPSGECLALQCGDSYYSPQLCNTSLQQICQKEVTLIGTTWLDSLEKCKASSSYLLGNLTLTNVTESCHNRTNTGPLWVGIAKQTYSGIDRGDNLAEDDEKTFQRCQKCRNNNCTFVSCNDSRWINRVHCSEVTQPNVTYPAQTMTYPLTTDFTASTTATPWDTTEKSNTSVPPDITTSTLPRSDVAPRDNTPVSSIIVSIILVLIISGAIAVGVVVYFRRCRQGDKKSCNLEYQKKHSPTEDTEHCYNEIDKAPDSGYFVLQPQKDQCVSAVDESLEKESPYNETEEGEYDHLGNNLSRRKVEEDTYCHASSTKDRGYSDYDVTNHCGQQNLENAYDHTDNYTVSDYGHSQQGEAQDNYDYAK